MLANSIRNDKLITGINFRGREYKLSQYADDSSCLVRDEKSVEKIFEKLEAFRGCRGLELNRSKTEALWLGKTRPQLTNLFNINWPTKCVCLGVPFSCDSDASTKDNFKKTFVALEKCLNVWSSNTLWKKNHYQKFSSVKNNFNFLCSQRSHWFCRSSEQICIQLYMEPQTTQNQALNNDWKDKRWRTQHARFRYNR